MSKHIDTLEAWFDSGETGKYKMGDTIICKGNGGYSIMVANHSSTIDPDEDSRILHRAPKPKPAWHDAVAVIAHKEGDYGFTAREVYVSGVDNKWESAHYYARTSELIAPVPLIEQKVTDEMVLNYLNHSWGAEERGTDAFEEVEVRAARNALTAALGLDPA